MVVMNEMGFDPLATTRRDVGPRGAGSASRCPTCQDADLAGADGGPRTLLLGRRAGGRPPCASRAPFMPTHYVLKTDEVELPPQVPAVVQFGAPRSGTQATWHLLMHSFRMKQISPTPSRLLGGPIPKMGRLF